MLKSPRFLEPNVCFMKSIGILLMEPQKQQSSGNQISEMCDLNKFTSSYISSFGQAIAHRTTSRRIVL